MSSVTLEGGLTYPSFEEVAVKRAMIEAASEVILLADHSKFGHDSLVRVAPLTAVSTIVTSSSCDPATVLAIREAGIEVILADVPDTPESTAAG
jgi:DeoR family fructose operon transcriptional repressor